MRDARQVRLEVAHGGADAPRLGALPGPEDAGGEAYAEPLSDDEALTALEAALAAVCGALA